MSRPIIEIQNVGKRYLLDHEDRVQHGTLRESLINGFQALRARFSRNSPPDHPTRREEFWALQNLSFEVSPGDIVGIIGRNGAGKSTLFKILSRITEPTTGEICIRGRIASLLEVGTGFHQELTGRENIFLNGTILGMTRHEIRRKFDDIVAFAEVEKFLDTPVKRYSSGMYMRLAFAVAAHLEPEILIVDEVLAVGDVQFQKKCLGKMGEVARGGRTVLFVSHNMQAIEQLTTSVIILESGKLAYRGDTQAGIARYTSSVFRNLGSSSIYRNALSPQQTGLTRVEVITSNEHGEQLCRTPIGFEFDLSVRTAFKGLCFSFQIADDSGRPICHMWLFDREKELGKCPSSYRLRCDVKTLRLFIGRYVLRTFLTDRSGLETVETLSDICPFEVTMRGIERVGYEWRAGDMCYWEDFNWSLKEIS